MNKIRTLVIIFIILLLFASLFFFVQFAQFLFQIEQYYAKAPIWLIIFYIVGIALIALSALWLLLKFHNFSKGKTNKNVKNKPIVNDDESFHKKINQLEQSGAVTQSLLEQWQQLVKLRESEAVTLSLFGKVNVGKSSLINTLTQAEVKISARAGQTQQINSYEFKHNNRLYQLFDMPGLGEVDSYTENEVHDKAVKSHIVIFVADEDFTASTFESYQSLLAYNKPIIIVLNKRDYYTNEERSLISEQIYKNLQKISKKLKIPPIIWVQAKTKQMIEVLHSDGQTSMTEKQSDGDVSELINIIEMMTFDRLALDNQLSNSFYKSLDKDMNSLLNKTRRQKSEIIVKNYTQKAMLGGMASVGPGTDILLQGYLGLNMAKALCEIYQIDTNEIDIQNMLTQASTKIKKEFAMILSLVGNALKAFPGIGTIAGGALHAVAYGLIFEAVGKALINCLENTEQLDSKTILQQIEEQMHGNLEQSATRLAKIALSKKLDY